MRRCARLHRWTGEMQPTAARRVLVALCASGVLLVGAASARSHTDLVASRPHDGAVLETGPARLVLTFSDILGRPGTVIVEAPGGTARAEARLDPRDSRRMSASIQARASGEYAVSWTAVSADGHTLGGHLTFEVLAPELPRAVAILVAQVERCAATLRRVLTSL